MLEEQVAMHILYLLVPADDEAGSSCLLGRRILCAGLLLDHCAGILLYARPCGRWEE